MTKTLWVDPKLIVLGRGRPEENVLEVCKFHAGDGGPNAPTGDPCHIDGQGEAAQPCRGVGGS